MLPRLPEIEAAAEAVYAAMTPTPQLAWPLLAERLDAEVWVKHENHTPIGAFKLRGGLAYFATLAAEGGVRGVVCATRGNHGQSVALAAARHGLTATIVVPHGNSREKNAAMRAQGAELVVHGDDFQAALEQAARLAEERGLHPVPSFHRRLVAGVATCGLELLRAVPDLDVVYVPVGLGSGVCGMIAARDALAARTEVVAVVATGARCYAASLAAGRPVEAPVTTRIADGMACRTPDPEAFAAMRRGIARCVEVDDEAIEAAMRTLFAATHNVAEGAGAAAFAAATQERERLGGKKVAVVLSGGNVDTEVFARVLAAGPERAS